MRTGLVWLAIGLIAAGCGDDDSTDNGLGAAGVGVGVADAGGGAGTTASPANAGSSGSAGTRGSQSGGSGRNAGSGGSSESGRGSSGSDSAGGGGSSSGSATAGTQSDPTPPACDLQCDPGETCVLVEVQCFRAPCPAQPMCMPEASSGQACGSRGHGPCPEGQYCQFAPGTNCGAADQGGRCVERRAACTREYRPVCGCDGKTYGNACEAGAAGTSVASEGECGARADADCDRRKVACDAAEPPCRCGPYV